MHKKPFKLGVIGGTALMELQLTDVKKHQPNTPFGVASARFVEGTLPGGQRVVFLPRHGISHQIQPSAINYRAIVYGMKKLGVTHLLSISAVGSLQEEIIPGKHLVIPDQLFDQTKGIRARTFFENGMAVHVPMGNPFCSAFRELLIQSAELCKSDKIHPKGTLIVMEGPQFSTRAESIFFRKTVPGAAVIGMTAQPEAALAREAGLSYATLCLPADYDAWREGEEVVTADAVKAGLEGFGDVALRIISSVAANLNSVEDCNCAQSLEGFAVHTFPEARLLSEKTDILGVPREN